MQHLDMLTISAHEANRQSTLNTNEHEGMQFMKNSFSHSTRIQLKHAYLMENIRKLFFDKRL